MFTETMPLRGPYSGDRYLSIKIYITEEDRNKIQNMGKNKGITQAEIMRRALESYLENYKIEEKTK
jgi:predicted DNA-binding protein